MFWSHVSKIYITQFLSARDPQLLSTNEPIIGAIMLFKNSNGSSDENVLETNMNRKQIVFYIATIYASILSYISYGIIGVTGYKMVRFLRTQQVQSEDTRKKMMTLSKVIILQAAIPFFAIVPAALTLYIYMLLVHDSKLGEYITYAFLSLIPALDPLVPLWYIKSYRKFALNLFTCKGLLQQEGGGNGIARSARQKNSTNRMELNRETLF